MSAPKFRRVNLSRIPKEKRREAWEKLQRKYPKSAAWLTEPLVQAMREKFNPKDIIVDIEVGDE